MRSMFSHASAVLKFRIGLSPYDKPSIALFESFIHSFNCHISFWHTYSYEHLRIQVKILENKLESLGGKVITEITNLRKNLDTDGFLPCAQSIFSWNNSSIARTAPARPASSPVAPPRNTKSIGPKTHSFVSHTASLQNGSSSSASEDLIKWWYYAFIYFPHQPLMFIHSLFIPSTKCHIDEILCTNNAILINKRMNLYWNLCYGRVSSVILVSTFKLWQTSLTILEVQRAHMTEVIGRADVFFGQFLFPRQGGVGARPIPASTNVICWLTAVSLFQHTRLRRITILESLRLVKTAS